MTATTGHWPMDGVISPFERNFQHLGIGQMVISDGPKPMMTVLGSCLALVVFSPYRQITGMIHAIFPSRGNSTTHDDRHFVREGFEELLNQMQGMVGPKGPMVFKLFGGASMMASRVGAPAFLQPGAGEVNLFEARAWLDRQKIQLNAEDVGGYTGRKLIVNPTTGEVHVRLLNSNQPKIPKDPRVFPD